MKRNSVTPRSQTTPSCSLNSNSPNNFGLWEVSSSDDADTDIVAVHGMDGNRERSWSAYNGVLWLRDLIPARIPRVRIFSYGYDANTRGRDQLSTSPLYTLAVNLIIHLASKRKSTSTEERPIIFIAHSLGGILLKYALIYAHSCGKNHLPSHKAVEVSTSAILYFGTPHQGSKGADLASIVLNILSAFGKGSTTIVNNIRPGSKMLQQQLLQYQAISSNYDTKFYFETYRTVISPFTQLLLVPQSSAAVPGAVNAEMIPLDRDHVNMVKFESAEDGAFQLVSSHLSVMVSEAPQKIANKWKKQKIFEDDNSGATMMSNPASPISEYSSASGSTLKTTPAMLPVLPYQQASESFVGRGHTLDWIHEMFKKQHKIVLYGIGGIGKTGIAAEYVYTYRRDYDIIFWVNGDSKETTTSGFITIARQLVKWKAKNIFTGSSKANLCFSQVAQELGLGDFVDQKGKVSDNAEDREAIVEATKEYLSTAESWKWLLVFDHLDELDSFDLTAFFPIPLVGWILITSRKQERCSLGIGYEVTALSTDDGVKLLIEKSRKGYAGDSDAHQIVRTLEGIPLAIEVVGEYLAANQRSFKSYLAMEDSWKRVFTRKIQPYGKSLVDTWEVSYRAIAARNPSAANILFLCAFLGSEEIPEQLFHGVVGVGAALEQLFAFCLAKRGSTETVFSIHPLFHEWIRERLDGDQKTAKVTEVVILLGNAIHRIPLAPTHIFVSAKHALDYCLPKLQARSDKAIFRSLEEIASHEKGPLLRGMIRFTLEAIKSVEGPDSMETFMVMEQLGHSYFGDIVGSVGQKLWDALQKERRSKMWFGWKILNTIRVQLHPEHERSIVDEYSRQGGFDNIPVQRFISTKEQRMEGLRLIQSALEGLEKILGSDHIETLHTIHCLAHFTELQGLYEEAEKLGRRGLEGREKTLGLDHVDTLRSVHHLARLLHSQRRLEEAEEFYLRALEGRRRILGSDHADTLDTVHSLAFSVKMQGRFEEAEKLEQCTLEGCEKALGLDHLDTFHTVYNLAMIAYDQGRFEEAEKFYLRALEGYDSILGSDHIDTLDTLHDLACSVYMQKRFEEAERFGRRALEGRERMLGLNHADTLQTCHNLAMSVYDLGDFQEAEELGRRAFEHRKNTLGLDHVDTLHTVNNLALSVKMQGRFEDAENFDRYALERREKDLGLDHADTLQTLHNLALSVKMQGRFGEAEKLERRALEGRENVLGPDHADTLQTVHNVAMSVYHQGRFAEAEQLKRRALDGREKTLGLDHPDTLHTVHNLAMSVYEQDRFKEAEQLERRALKTREEILGPGHADTLQTAHNLAMSVYNQGRTEEAKNLERYALEGRQRTLGVDHLDTLHTVHNLAISMYEQARFEEAENLERRALEGRQRILGSKHPDTLVAVQGLILSVHKQGRYQEVERLCNRVLRVLKGSLGFDHATTLQTVDDPAMQLEKQLRSKETGKQHPWVRKLLGLDHTAALGGAASIQRHCEEAEALYRQIFPEGGKSLKKQGRF